MRDMATEPVNEVRLVGRVSGQPQERELPSGDRVATFRVVVERPRRGEAAKRVDALECAAWTARLRRSVAGWAEGDVVEVHGAMRRRFYRTGSGATSVVEVEVTRVRRVSRAAAPRRRASA